MRAATKSVLCWLGWHSWDYIRDMRYGRIAGRVCTKCGQERYP